MLRHFYAQRCLAINTRTVPISEDGFHKLPVEFTMVMFRTDMQSDVCTEATLPYPEQHTKVLSWLADLEAYEVKQKLKRKHYARRQCHEIKTPSSSSSNGEDEIESPSPPASLISDDEVSPMKPLSRRGDPYPLIPRKRAQAPLTADLQPRKHANDAENVDKTLASLESRMRISRNLEVLKAGATRLQQSTAQHNKRKLFYEEQTRDIERGWTRQMWEDEWFFDELYELAMMNHAYLRNRTS